MGFFDKKSRLLRKKIKDLQAELKRAERGGQYEVKEGIFFAKLQDMGEQTMMAFAGGEGLSAQEEIVIQQFFHRNGFVVERVKLSAKAGTLSDLYVEPPRELILAVARDLKTEEDFRMVDDSERSPRPVDMEKKIYPLSVLLDVSTALFAERVRSIIATTEIKQNKEGARLLSWMPAIMDFFVHKHGEEVFDLTRACFDNAFDKLYAGAFAAPKEEAVSQAQRLEEYRKARQERAAQANAKAAAPPKPKAPPAPPQDDAEEDEDESTARMAPSAKPKPPSGEALRSALEGSPPAGASNGAASSPPPPAAPPKPQAQAPAASPAPAPAPASAGSADSSHRLLKLHKVRAEIYRSLVRANSSRCIRNSIGILEKIADLFDATACCLMTRPAGHSDGLAMFAQGGDDAQWHGQGGGLPIPEGIVIESLDARGVVRRADDGELASNMARALRVDGEIVGTIYLGRRRGLPPFGEGDEESLGVLAKIFEEFADLTLGVMV